MAGREQFSRVTLPSLRSGEGRERTFLCKATEIDAKQFVVFAFWTICETSESFKPTKPPLADLGCRNSQYLVRNFPTARNSSDGIRSCNYVLVSKTLSERNLHCKTYRCTFSSIESFCLFFYK